MTPFGPMTLLSMGECGIAVLLWVVSFATRGWLVGSSNMGSIDVGLFKTSVYVGSHVIDYDTSSILKDVGSELDVTIGLVAAGGAFSVFSLGFMTFTIVRKEKILFLFFLGASILSGILTLVGVVLFKINYDIDYLVSVGYSWYLALGAYVFQWSSVGALAAAIRRGEIAFGGFNTMR